MTIQEMREKKSEKGYSYAQIAELSGVPLGTVQKIFTGETVNPRYDTLQALEKLFSASCMVCEKQTVYGERKQGSYTLEDYYALPDDQRVELIDGAFLVMEAPTAIHQLIAGEMHRQIANFIYDNDGTCIPLISPFDVQLDRDEKTMVQPDVGVLCDREKLKKKVIYGAPDFVLEVLSPSTRRKDGTIKLSKYCSAGVREYWLIDPDRKKLVVYDFENDQLPAIYGMEKPVPVMIFGGKLEIHFDRILSWMDMEMKE